MNYRVGALFTFSGECEKVVSRVGISFISVARAQAYIRAEIPTYNLTAVVEETVEEWNVDVFSKIQVDTSPSVNQTNLWLLYSSMYFMHLMPSDRTDENPLWESDEPSWDDFYTLCLSPLHPLSSQKKRTDRILCEGDIFRCTTSLYHLIQPTRYIGMIRALIDIYRYIPNPIFSFLSPMLTQPQIDTKATCPTAAAETGTAKPKAEATQTTSSPTPT